MDDDKTPKIRFLKKGERKSGIKGKVKLSLQNQSIEELLKEGQPTLKRKKKSKNTESHRKLKFKKSYINGELKVDLSKQQPEPNCEENSYSQSPQLTSTIPSSQNKNPKQKQKPESRRGVTEFGPDINGYRFVSLNSDEQPDISNVNFTKYTAKPCPDYRYSERVPESSIQIDDPYKSQMYKDDIIEEIPYDYEEYCERWDFIKEGKDVDGIPLPTSNNLIQNLDIQHMRSFLKSRENVKKERIRWHPDQMINRLRAVNFCGVNSIEAEKIVTLAFQIVNELYEMRKF